MQLRDVHNLYATASKTASETARQLAFAGIAIIWLLSGAKLTSLGGLNIPHDLRAPGLLLVVSLGLDFLHAAYRAAAFGVYGRVLEWKGTGDDDEVNLPAAINWVSLLLFWLKLASLGTAYGFIAVYVFNRI